MSEKFRHFTRVEPETEWQHGLVGLAVRWKGLVAWAVGDTALAGLSFWVIHWALGVVLLIAGIFVAASLMIVRHYRLQRLTTDNRLHAFCHSTRDDVAELLACDKRKQAENLQKLSSFYLKSAQQIVDFYRDLTGDSTIGSAIRIAEVVDETDMYVTKARAGHINQAARSSKSEPVASDEGLPRTLRTKEYEGVLIIEDIPYVINAGMWNKTANDELPDIKSVIVAPINGWNNGQRVMLGMLYVTSAKSGTFKPSHVAPLNAFVDILGTVYPIILDRILKSTSKSTSVRNKSTEKQEPANE